MESYHSDISKIHSAGNAFAMQRYSDIKPLYEHSAGVFALHRSKI